MEVLKICKARLACDPQWINTIYVLLTGCCYCVYMGSSLDVKYIHVHVCVTMTHVHVNVHVHACAILVGQPGVRVKKQSKVALKLATTHMANM